MSERVKHTFLSLKTLPRPFFHCPVCSRSLPITRRATPMGVIIQKKTTERRTDESIAPIASDNLCQTKETGLRTAGKTIETRIMRTDNFTNRILPEWKYHNSRPRRITKPVSLFFSRVIAVFGCRIIQLSSRYGPVCFYRR
jgi:hypothetical protein